MIKNRTQLKIENAAIVPVSVDEDLVPFLFKNFNGSTSEFQGKICKVIDFRRNSPIGKFLRINCIKCNRPILDQDINIYIIFQNEKPKSSIYQSVNGRYTHLELPTEVQKDFNRFLRDIFNASFMSFCDGWVFSHNGKGIKDAIKQFIILYELDNYLNEPYTLLERKYYRKRGEVRLEMFAK